MTSDRAQRKRRLRGALLLTLTFFLVEVVGGILSRSLALLADAAHMFTDVAALILAYAAMTLADRAPTKKHTFGLNRAEILAAFINAQVLLVISGYILYEAYKRLREPPEIRTGIMLWVALSGLIANLISMKLLRKSREESLNLKAAYLEVLTDTLGSLGVIAAALVMRPTGWFWLDPVLSVALGLLIVPRTISILRQSGHILLEGTPRGIDMALLRSKLLEIRGVAEIHDLHLWTLTSGVNSASVHVRADPTSPRGEVLEKVQELFEKQAGVDHATIQVEWGSGAVVSDNAEARLEVSRSNQRSGPDRPSPPQEPDSAFRPAVRRIAAVLMPIAPRTISRLSVIAALAFTVVACASVAQLSNVNDPSCAAIFEDQLTSILVQQGESSEVSSGLALRSRLALVSNSLGPRPFLVSSSSGTDYAFFVQAKRSACLLRLYGRRKGFVSYTNNLTYIATRPLPTCACTG